MLKNFLSTSLLAATLAVAGCSSPEPTATSAPKVEGPAVEYDLGFFAPERGQDGSTWRWMGREGVIYLKNTHRDMVLTIKGRTPTELPEPATISVSLNEEPLDRILGVRGEVEKKYDIPAAMLGNSDRPLLRVITSLTFVPRSLIPSSADDRRLGFAVDLVSWEPK
jgi:hypothetical protein